MCSIESLKSCRVRYHRDKRPPKTGKIMSEKSPSPYLMHWCWAWWTPVWNYWQPECSGQYALIGVPLRWPRIDNSISNTMQFIWSLFNGKSQAENEKEIHLFCFFLHQLTVKSENFSKTDLLILFKPVNDEKTYYEILLLHFICVSPWFTKFLSVASRIYKQTLIFIKHCVHLSPHPVNSASRVTFAAGLC